MSGARAGGHSATFNLARRRWLIAGVFGALGWIAPPSRPGSAGAHPASAEWLLALIGDPDATRRIGEAYLAGHEDEQDAGLLIALLRSSLADDAVPSEPEAVAPRERQMAMRRLIEEEFRQERVVDVDGWILSRSEARLYALHAMLMRPRR
jgi:hypothetical protein